MTRTANYEHHRQAYRLHDKSGHSYMREAVDEIVNLLTEDNFKKSTVVIFAGYEKEMDTMLQNVNPGLRSRVTQRLKFNEFSAHDVSQVVQNVLQKKNLPIEEDACTKMPDLAQELIEASGFSNGRDAETWAKRIVAERAACGEEQVSLNCVRRALDSMLDGRSKMDDSASEYKTSRSTPDTVIPLAVAHPNFETPIKVNTASAHRVECVAKHAIARAGDDDGENDAILAALEEACVELGYDIDLSARENLVGKLEAVLTGDEFPQDILSYVLKKMPTKSETLVSKALRSQVPSVLTAFIKHVAYGRELERMDAVERKKEVARQRAISEMGRCPAGFAWHREGHGWRCGGGSHFVPDSDLPEDLRP